MCRQWMSWGSLAVVILSSWPCASAVGGETLQAVAETENEWPQWNGRETIAAYARRAGLRSARIIRLGGGGVSLELVLVPAGSFQMGRDTGCAPEEKPVHTVTFAEPFYMGKYETTQDQYAKVMGSNPSSFKNARNPVENVSWEDAQAFCKKLSEIAKQTAQLPTEAQWEYACRAGTNKNEEGTVFNEGWHDNSGRHPHRVGEKRSNPWGLHDMYGNVGEWCADWYDRTYYRDSPGADPQGPEDGSDRVLRGGSWADHVAGCMPACRHKLHPVTRYYKYGFRVVVDASKEQ